VSYYIPSRSNYRSSQSLHPGSWIVGVLVILGLLAWPVISFTTAHLNNSVQTLRVTRLDDQATGKNGHQYLVFTDRGVYKDTDNFWAGKFNSSDLYNQLRPGQTYVCHVHGTRNHFTSNYPDIMSCQHA
jgi:hypothetical protein